MPVGVLINCVSVFCGGLVGALLGRTFPEKLKSDLPVLFGFCSIAIGINSIITVHAMTVVVLSILIGFIIGYVLHLEVIVNRIFTKLVEGLNPRNKEMDMDLYITAAVLFCCSGFSWYGAMVEGMAGDSSLLLSKSILDFFTAVVFATTFGKSICAIAGPQVVLLLSVFGAGSILGPMLTPDMFFDFSACGGILTFAAGMRVAKIKSIPLINLIPALVLVMPFSALWTLVM